ncbi:hypothetical protein ACFE04_012651 [Oxalis oulophora]
MGTRWKSKDAQAEALAYPMSDIVSKLRDFLLQSIAYGMLSEHSVILVAVEAKSFHLFHRACFSQTREDTERIVLSLYEAFYLCYSLKCLTIVDQDKSTMDVGDIWLYMKSKEPRFPEFYKAYCHLRSRNWVVRPGLQYGGDFVVYRHHPSLVHSEYVVIVSSVGVNGRLRVWSDYYCTIRLCLGVAKTLLVLSINKNNQGSVTPSCLDLYGVEEQTVTRWIPEQSREDQSIVQKENN